MHVAGVLLISTGKSSGYMNVEWCYYLELQNIKYFLLPQADVYTKVAKPLIESVITGYNATVFAYGATGES